MNRANQHALYQQTNQGLLGIRQAEINYYINLNVAFGTQAALIGGFTYGVFTQNQFNEDTPYSKVFQDIYWVCSAGTIAASVHVILTTMLLQVLGPGLALHGPIGSMARACEGMRNEQRAIITGFIFMVILFSVSTILSFWAVMSLEAASGATAVWLIASRYYYFYCERIYLRFYWKEESELWRRSADEHNPDPNDYEPPVAGSPVAVNPVHGIHHPHVNSRAGSVDNAPGQPEMLPRINSFTPFSAQSDLPRVHSHMETPFRSQSTGNTGSSAAAALAATEAVGGKKSKSKMFSGSWFKGKKRTTSSSSALQEQLLRNPTANTGLLSASGQNPRAIAMEGFLMIQRGARQSSTTSSSKASWDRRYITLNYAGQLYVYTSRIAYRENPRSPVYRRPLLIHEYDIVAFNSEQQQRLHDISDTNSVMTSTRTAAMATTSSSGHVLFQWTLIPREEETETGGEQDKQHSSSDSDAASVHTGGHSANDSQATGSKSKKEQRSRSRREWTLRSDTAEEWNLWSDVLQQLAPDCFRSFS